MEDLTMCIAGAVIALIIVYVILEVQISRLETDTKHLKQREFEICCFCNKLRDGEKPALPLAEACYCGGEHHE